jgi:hypothetical protein
MHAGFPQLIPVLVSQAHLMFIGRFSLNTAGRADSVAEKLAGLPSEALNGRFSAVTFACL